MANRSEKRIEFLKDVLSTAIEGGIDYWAVLWDYDCDKGTATIQVWNSDNENGVEGEKFYLTIDSVARGLKLLVEVGDVPAEIKKNVGLADKTNGDDGDYDSIDADCIVQMAVFGKVIYG